MERSLIKTRWSRLQSLPEEHASRLSAAYEMGMCLMKEEKHKDAEEVASRPVISLQKCNEPEAPRSFLF